MSRPPDHFVTVVKKGGSSGEVNPNPKPSRANANPSPKSPNRELLTLSPEPK